MKAIILTGIALSLLLFPRISLCEIDTEAVPGEDQWVYGGDTVTLDGSASASADTFHWEQVIVGDEPIVILDNQDPLDGTTHFEAPSLGVGAMLTFRLTVTGPTGSDSAETHVYVRATHAPQVAPQNIRAYPGHLSFRLEWDPLIDAEDYGVGYKLAPGMYFWFWTDATYYRIPNLTEGHADTAAVRGRNRYGEGAMSEDITLVPMRNYALPATLGGTRPPSEYVYTVSHFDIAGMNDTVLDDHNDSWDANPKSEDYWGYLWPQRMYLDHLVYFTGNVLADGGWFTDLRVQYTKDGVEWLDVPTRIVPPYDFTDAPTGRTPYQRYDMYIPTLFARGIRIYGTPGGTSSFTSISEVEVLADHVTPPVLEPLNIVRSENQVTLAWEEFGDGEYTVELTNDLPNGTWQTPPGEWPITERSWADVNVMTSADMICFYRVESDGKHTVPVGVIKVVIPKGGLTMLSVPLAAADPGLNGDPGCIGDMIKENLTGGSGVATADKVWKWDPARQVYQTAFLVAGWGEPYDGRWWDAQAGGFSTMTLDGGETFWLDIPDRETAR